MSAPCQPCRSGRCEDCRRLGLGCDCCGGDVSAPVTLDPLGILTDDEWRALHDDLAKIAEQRRLAADEAANWRMA